MNETVFLKNNADDWRRIETSLDTPHLLNPDDLSALYLRLTDDLAWAKPFYPQSKTTQYLNTLTSRIHQRIYKNKKERRGRLKDFWLREWPALMYRHRKQMFYSLLITVVFTAVGALSSANDKSFVRMILGDGYVNMTMENIKHHNPMAVYKQMNGTDMFFGITLNNIRVSFLAFASGILLSFGTIVVLLQNGIMLGTFHYMFYEQNMLADAMRTIWIHGTLEITAIVVAGGAGMVMGNSILFPGTYSRRVSFARGARNGMKIVVGLVPVFICAGFLESFVTRHTDMPLILNIAIIGGSLCFVLGYLVLFPFAVKHRTALSTDI